MIPANAELTPRPAGLPSWESLPPDEKKLLVIEIFGDNGGSAEGGPDGYDAKDAQGKPLSIQQRLATSDAEGSELYMNHFAAAWAWALSTPFQGTKMDASHLGGTTDPMIISWPQKIHDKGGLRSQFQHVTDIAPSIYEAAQIKTPDRVNGAEQLPLEGGSLLYTFDHADQPSNHHVQYFATVGNLAIYKDGWWAGRRAWSSWEPNPAGGADKRPWELYHTSDDYSQAHDLAAAHPEKLKELQQLFDQEAKRNNVYPIFQPNGKQPLPGGDRKLLVLRDGVERLPNAVLPHISGHSFTLTADVETPPSGANGVILAQGSRYGGFTLYVDRGHVVYEVNAFGSRTGRLVSQTPLRPGKAHIVLKVEAQPIAGSPVGAPAKAGSAQLTINGAEQGNANFTNINGSSYTETLDVGSDLGSAVSSA